MKYCLFFHRDNKNFKKNLLEKNPTVVNHLRNKCILHCYLQRSIDLKNKLHSSRNVIFAGIFFFETEMQKSILIYFLIVVYYDKQINLKKKRKKF